jgi:uncharacterized membrane protein YcaP (DUF421 family)
VSDLLSTLGASWNDLAVVVVAGVAIYGWVIAATRLVGLRSFAKMSAFDFSMTVAIGSIIASTATGSVALASGVFAVAVLFAAQFTVAWARRRSAVDRVVDNRPLLLMDGPHVLEGHLARARLTPDDLRAKLREAGVLRLDQVRAVVFETTGDVTVLQGEGPYDERLLEGVRR